MTSLTDGQQIVLKRLRDEQYPKNQPLSTETNSADALARRGLVRYSGKGRASITVAGKKALAADETETGGFDG